ncbi:MAG: NAD-dependent epimerase/dehydratase family protein [Candidatus Latescibacteria bacterium]|nr:NAD-dependent epimerase/dehydratase family protein [Candidatus Latescibacterota bacterium]
MRPPYEPQRILVTGATGVLGRALMPALAALGAPFRILVHQTKLDPLPERPPLDIRRADLARPESLRGIAEGCDVVVHAAARTGFASLAREGQRRINLEGTGALLREARSADVRAFVFIGYAGTIQERDDAERAVDEDTLPEGRYVSDYVRMKYEAEAMVLESNQPGAMRSMVVSPGVLLHRGAPTLLGGLIQAFAARELPYRMLERVWLAISDGLDVGRCVSAAVALGHGGRRYLATGACVRLGELYTLLTGITGIPAPRRALPDKLVEELGFLTPLLPKQSFLRKLVLPRDLVLHLRRLAPVRNDRTRSELAFAPTALPATLAAVAGSPDELAGGKTGAAS